jgi:hypothetical protein
VRAVNLLPRDAAQAKSIRNEDPAVVVGSALGLIVIIALSAGFITAHSNASSAQSKLTAARIELGKLSLHKQAEGKSKPAKPTRPIIPVPPVIASDEQPRLAAIADALSSRIAWDRILREFSLVVPDDITISTLTMTAPSSTPGATSGLSISGLAYSHDSVARLLSRLMLIPDLNDVMLSSSMAAAGGAAGVQFTITTGVKGAPVPVTDTTATDTTPTDTSSTTTGASS